MFFLQSVPIFLLDYSFWLLLRWLLLQWLLLGWLLLRWLLLGSLFLTFNPNKTRLGETGYLGKLFFLLTVCVGIHFFDSPTFSQHSQSAKLLLPTPHCTALSWLTEHHVIPMVIKCFPPNPYPLKKGIFLSGKHSKHVLLLTYLACLQRLINNLRWMFNHVKTKDVLLVAKTLISSHFNQLYVVLTSFNQLPKVIIKNCSLKKYISELLFQRYISKLPSQKIHFKRRSEQFKVTNHCCCLTKKCNSQIYSVSDVYHFAN